MTPEEFDFWQRAYLAALEGRSPPLTSDWVSAAAVDGEAKDSANYAVISYRAAKATVVQP